MHAIKHQHSMLFHQHKVDLVTRPDTDPVAALFRLELTE